MIIVNRSSTLKKGGAVMAAAAAVFLVISMGLFRAEEPVEAQEQDSGVTEKTMMKTTDKMIPKIDRDVPVRTRTATFALG